MSKEQIEIDDLQRANKELLRINDTLVSDNEENEDVINELTIQIRDLEQEIEAYKSQKTSISTLYYILCDRYDLCYHTNKQKLIYLVTQELNI